MKATLTIRLKLTDGGGDRLRRPIRGIGGFQNLLRTLQARLTDDNVLTLTPALAGKIARYVQSYGQGGLQGRLDPVLAQLAELAKALEPMAA